MNRWALDQDDRTIGGSGAPSMEGLDILSIKDLLVFHQVQIPQFHYRLFSFVDVCELVDELKRKHGITNRLLSACK